LREPVPGSSVSGGPTPSASDAEALPRRAVREPYPDRPATRSFPPLGRPRHGRVTGAARWKGAAPRAGLAPSLWRAQRGEGEPARSPARALVAATSQRSALCQYQLRQPRPRVSRVEVWARMDAFVPVQPDRDPVEVTDARHTDTERLAPDDDGKGESGRHEHAVECSWDVSVRLPARLLNRPPQDVSSLLRGLGGFRRYP